MFFLNPFHGIIVMEVGKMYNILICDDEKDIVAALRIYLSGNDYELYEAYNGREALDIIRNNDIHLVLHLLKALSRISAEDQLLRIQYHLLHL